MKRERRRGGGLELQDQTVYFPYVQVQRVPPDEGEKEAPPRSSKREREKGGPRASRRSMPPGLIPGAGPDNKLFPLHGGRGAGATSRRAVYGRLLTG